MIRTIPRRCLRCTSFCIMKEQTLFQDEDGAVYKFLSAGCEELTEQAMNNTPLRLVVEAWMLDAERHDKTREALVRAWTNSYCPYDGGAHYTDFFYMLCAWLWAWARSQRGFPDVYDALRTAKHPRPWTKIMQEFMQTFEIYRLVEP